MAIAQYSFPTTIRYGAGVVQELAGALAAEGLKRPLLVTDRALAELPPAATVKKVLRSLNLAVFSDIEGNPVASQASRGGEACVAHAADCIVALGGGAALDVAKAIAVLATHPGPILAYDAFLEAPQPIDAAVPPIFAIPTTAGTGSEVGRSAVISDDATHQKKIIFSPKLLARCVYLDPELSVGLPAKVTAATGMDALTHCIEAFLAKDFHPMCDGIALEGLRLCATYLPRAFRFAQAAAQDPGVYTDPAHLEARGMMLNAATMGAVAFQKELGVTHACAHALSTVCDLHHGLANAVMLPYAMRFNLEVAEARMTRLAHAVELSTPEAFITWIERLRQTLEIPATLAELDISDSAIEALTEVALADACHQFNPRPVSADDFRALFRAAQPRLR